MIGALYGGATTLARPLVLAWLRRRRARGKEDAARFGERLGIPGKPRPPGPLVWLHAASVGEAQSMLPLLARMREARPDLALLVTTGTVTSAKLLAQRLPPDVVHQYVPVDRPAYVERFLDHWSPDAAIWIESELWPNLLRMARGHGVPTMLVNARMSERSFRRWRRLPGLIGPLLDGFELCLAQTPGDAERLRALGARRVDCLGNLKTDAAALPAEPEALEALQEALGGRPNWLAASTHPGEEDAAARAHLALRAELPGLLTVIVPRHPERGEAVAREIAALGLEVARRSAGEAPDAGTGVYVADTLGELGLFYRLAEAVFVGGSLVPHGGQNLLEPARLGCAILFGPHVGNFADIAERLLQAGGAERVADGAALTAALGRLLADAERRRTMAEKARAASAGEDDVAARVFGAVAPLLPQERAVARA